MRGVRGIATVWRAWRSLRGDEFAFFLCGSLLLGAVDLGGLMEVNAGGRLGPVLARHLSQALLIGAVMLACWLPLARSAASGAARWRGLVAAALIGSALGLALNAALVAAVGWPSVCDLFAAQKGMPPCSRFRWVAQLGDTLWVFLPSLLAFSLLDLRERRRQQDAAVQALLHEHAELRQRAGASRLAAVQAQIDPEALFQALLAIEQAYARGEPQAGAQLEQLIHHLRERLAAVGARLQTPAPR
jgi:hypothetical protein